MMGLGLQAPKGACKQGEDQNGKPCSWERHRHVSQTVNENKGAIDVDALTPSVECTASVERLS